MELETDVVKKGRDCLASAAEQRKKPRCCSCMMACEEGIQSGGMTGVETVVELIF